jgi:DNA-binding MurR/RpiR family transcriptional regulator
VPHPLACQAVPGPLRALIAGITAHARSYLADLLLDRGYEVHGTVRRSSTEKFERIEHRRDRRTLIAISTSGASSNVLAAVEAARELGVATIGLTGGDGGALAGAVDLCLLVPAQNTARIQEAHILIAHVLCELTERQID